MAKCLARSYQRQWSIPTAKEALARTGCRQTQLQWPSNLAEKFCSTGKRGVCQSNGACRL